MGASAVDSVEQEETTEVVPEVVVAEVEEPPKKGAKKSAGKRVIEEAEDVGTSAPVKKSGRKGASAVVDKPVEVEETVVPSEDNPARRGRAASKAASDKISSDIKELSNLASKKRRPDEVSPEDDKRSEISAPSARGSKRKAADVAPVIEEVEEPVTKRATRGKRK